MTAENNIEIKKQDRFWLLKGIFCLLFMLGSLFIALLPLISDAAKQHSMFFYIFGGISFVLLTALFSYLLYKEMKPTNAIILNAHGFVDTINIGNGIEIEWTNVASVKMLGKANMPFLGVTLENTDLILENMKKSLADEMRENIEQSLPTILIPQSSVRISIKELKALFSKFSREARALESDTPKKPKNNPFTTDDVLRAFGKLPKNETNDNPEKDTTPDSDDNNVDPMTSTKEVAPVINGEITVPFEIPEDVVSAETTEDKDRKISASDSFYEALRAKASVKTPARSLEVTVKINSDDAVPTESQDVVDDMPEDMKMLLTKAKSTRIAEIEKILTDEDTPYILSRENNSAISEEHDKNDGFEEAVLATPDVPYIFDDVVDDPTKKIKTDLAGMFRDESDESKSEEFEELDVPQITIDVPEHDSNADTKEFVLDFTGVFGDKRSESNDITDDVDQNY